MNGGAKSKSVPLLYTEQLEAEENEGASHHSVEGRAKASKFSLEILPRYDVGEKDKPANRKRPVDASIGQFEKWRRCRCDKLRKEADEEESAFWIEEVCQKALHKGRLCRETIGSFLEGACI